MDVDWSATLSGVNAQPINPITRITSFFGSREVPVVSAIDQGALDASMAQLAANSDRAPVEGAVVFENGKATGVFARCRSGARNAAGGFDLRR